MTPAEPIRERIMTAVAVKLASIAAGPTYWQTPALVTRGLLAATQYKAELEQGTVYGVTRGSGSLLTRTAQPDTPGGGGIYEVRFRFTVEAYIQARAGVMAGTWLNRAWEDHRIALMSDLTLGGLVLDLEAQEDATDNGAWEPLAWFAQAWVAFLVGDY